MSIDPIILGPSSNKKANSEEQNLDKDGLEMGTTKEIVLVKKLKTKTKSFLYIWFSLIHSFRWSQFKRHFQEKRKRLFLGSIFLLNFFVLSLAFIPELGCSFWDTDKKKQQTKFQASSNIRLASLPTQNTRTPLYRLQETLVFDPDTISISEKEAIQNISFKHISDQKKEQYIKRFVHVAQTEMKKYVIPASIILGLAILNSDFGLSSMAVNANNHFKMPCSEDNLVPDEGIWRVDTNCYIYYKNAWSSFRANSLYFEQTIFDHLKKSATTDYKPWAFALEHFGYNKPNFHSKQLIAIIENYKLYQFDTF